jgi:hypothetical protein
VRRHPALAALLLLAAWPAAGAELRIERAAGACPVEPAERWGARTEVFAEGDRTWRVTTATAVPELSEPPAFAPLAEAVARVRGGLAYDVGTWSEDPDEALRAGRGNCVSFTAVLERLLRERGYRTRRVHGLLFSRDGGLNPFYLAPLHATPHRWLEVLSPELGWVPLDPVAPGGRVTPLHLALRGDDTAGWLRGTRIEVLQWD